jgi:hypothetical protein
MALHTSAVAQFRSYGTRLALAGGVAGLIWISDRDPGIRAFFEDVVPEAEVLAPDELTARLAVGQRPDALIVDGTQLLELPPEQRASVLGLRRVLICTGMLLASMPLNLVSGPGIAILAKPFCVEDLEAAIDWLRGAPPAQLDVSVPMAAFLDRPRRPRRRQPAH